MLDRVHELLIIFRSVLFNFMWNFPNCFDVTNLSTVCSFVCVCVQIDYVKCKRIKMFCVFEFRFTGEKKIVSDKINDFAVDFTFTHQPFQLVLPDRIRIKVYGQLFIRSFVCVCNRWLHNNIDCSNHILWGGWKRCIVYHVNDYLHKGKILGLCAVIFLIHFSIAKRYRCNEYVCQFVGKKAVKHISNWHINERARVHQDNSHTDRARDCNWTRHHKLALSLELTWKCLSLFSLCVCVRIIILSATRITRLSANNEEILEISACHSIKLIPSLWYDCNGMPILSIIIFVWSFDRLFYLFSLFYPLLFAFGALYWTSSTDSEVQNPNVPHILFKLKCNAL